MAPQRATSWPCITVGCGRVLRRLLLLPLLVGLSWPVQAQPAQAGQEVQREVQLAADAFTRGEALPAWAQRLPIPETRRTEAVVVRLLDTQVRLDGGQAADFLDEAIQINNSAALAVIGQYKIQFVPAYQTLKLHSVRLLRGSQVLDRTADVGVRFLQRETGLEQGVYSGQVTASLLLADVRVGDTLSIAYSRVGSNPVFGGQHADARGWDQPMRPMERRRVLISHRVERPLHWRMLGDHRPPVAPTISRDGDWETLVFDERGVEAMSPEPFVPDIYFEDRVLTFSEFQDWNAVARWADALFAPVASLPDELTPLVQRWAALPEASESVAEALRWVQREIRYFSVALGESSHRPTAPAQVLQRRYGDCKDKTYLLLSLLRALGIEARPVLLALSAPRMPGRALPAPTVFDHVVLQVRLDGHVYYLEPTAQAQPVPLAMMAQPGPQFQGLLVDAGTTGVAPLGKDEPPTRPDQLLEEQLQLPALAPAGILSARFTLTGAEAEMLRPMLPMITPAQRRDLAMSLYEKRYSGITLDGEPRFEDDPAANRIVIHSRYRVPKLAEQRGGGWVVNFGPHILQGFFKLPPSFQRQYPLQVVVHPKWLRYTVQVDWPEQVSSADDPSTRVVEGTVFRAETRSSFRGARFDFSLDFRTTASDVSAARAPGLIDDLNRLTAAIGGHAIVSASDLRNPAQGAADTVQVRRLRQSQELIDGVTRFLAERPPKGDDLGEALCMRASALEQLERWDEALRDSAQAVQEAPSLARAWVCRGEVLAHHGQFEAANAAFTRALVLGPAGAMRLYGRGVARFYLGQFDDAAADFAAALATGQEGGEYFLLWQIFSLQRAGKPLPPQVLAAARRDPDGAWPRPALAMLVGERSAEAMMAPIEAMTGDAQAMQLSEAAFYLGQHHLAQGRTAAARQAFERCRAQGIIGYTEHAAARHELARLGSP